MFSSPKHFHFTVEHLHYKLNRFPFAEYRLVQLSDLHLGFGLQGDVLESIVTTVAALSPDLVVITGDLIETTIDNVTESLAILTEISGRIPTYFVPGNHDFEYDPPQKVVRLLEELGIHVLLNRSVWIGKTEGFNLAGVCDPSGQLEQLDELYHPDIEKTLQRTRDNATTILLSHRPILRYLKERDIDLILSGHLHGGQILPFGLLSIFLHEDSGDHVTLRDKVLDGHRHLHVSNGIGYTTLPFRLFAHSKISCITLDPL